MVTQDEASDATIRTASLTKVFVGRGDPLTAVDHLDLTVQRGEIFGLLGPNGAGKTTTVGMLTTRVVPSSGGAWVAGIDVKARPSAVKQVIGVVPQTNTLDRSLNVRENLMFHGRYFGMTGREARDSADAMLAQFRLSDRATEEVDALSGGMAQRLMVARAVMHKPDVLFLDEPTAGLDPQSRLALWEVVQELHANGQTILLTTHYMEEADQLCQRVAIMDHGRILALDAPRQLKATVGAATEVRMQVNGDHLQSLATSLEHLSGTSGARVLDGTVYVYVDHGGPRLPELISAAERDGYTVTDVGVTEPTLETVFINLTGRELRE
ncbi:MAG TPA: ATP-binding cassette domain-containing protein [Acidimicrobiia bacterium]